MPRKQKQKVEINDNDSLQGLMQETYNDACLQILDSQKTINELVTQTTITDVDDATKVAKERGNLLKVKDSAIKIKLEIAKLQAEIIKHNGDVAGAVKQASHGEVTEDDLEAVRSMFTNKNTESLD